MVTLDHNRQDTLNNTATLDRTVQLWGQYFRTVNVVWHFMRSERTEDSSLLLETIRKMLPFLQSLGYFVLKIINNMMMKYALLNTYCRDPPIFYRSSNH